MAKTKQPHVTTFEEKARFPSNSSEEKSRLSKSGRIMRGFSTHVAVAVIVGTLSYGLAAEDAHSASATAIAAERSTYQQLAVYAGCAHVDQVGNFSWQAFPTAMDDATGEPIKAKRAKIVKVKGGAQ